MTLVGLIALAVAATPSPAVASESEPAFCESTTLHDYLVPLRTLPKLRELPYRRHAEPPFHGVDIGASGPSLAVNGGSAGYQLQWDRNPGWRLTLTFARVNGRGEVVRRLGLRHDRLGALGQALIAEPRFGLPRRPGLFRTTLLIRTANGRELGEFGNYYRVVRPTVHARLVTERTVYRPGETVFARLENPGASFTLFGEEFAVEKLEGESWVPAPDVEDPLHMNLYFVAPGATGGHCTVFPIPASTSPGHYRVSQEAVIGWPEEDHQRRPVLHAEFAIAP